MANQSKVFISYSHDSKAHKEQVFDLSETLRLHGIDADLDQYHENPPEGWPRWMRNRLEWADYVLVVCSSTYLRRFEGTETIGIGRGAKWEGAIITQNLYNAESEQSKFIPVIPSAGAPDDIPVVLQSATHYRMSTQSYWKWSQQLEAKTHQKVTP